MNDERSRAGYDPQNDHPSQPETLVNRHDETEKPSRSFSKVVFGHPADSFDRDQAITYYLALKLGWISAQTEVVFTRQVNADDLNDRSVLVIEGIDPQYKHANKLSYGNLTHDASSDLPAATTLYRNASRELENHPLASVLKDLTTWLNQADNKTEASLKLDSVAKPKLKLFTRIFNSYNRTLRHDPQNMVGATVQLLDTIINPDITIEQMAETFQTQLEEAEEYHRKKQVELSKILTEPNRLQTTTTFTGLKLTMCDVRGLDLDSGAITFAGRHTEADVVLLISDNPEAATGMVFKIAIPKLLQAKHRHIDLRKLMADRLDMSEMLFGKGTEFTVMNSVGGHQAIIGASPWQGSALNVEQLWAAVQDFFDSDRFSVEDLDDEVRQLQQELGTARATFLPMITPADAHSLPERVVAVTLPTEGTDLSTEITIQLTESDLYWLKQVWTTNQATNRRILLQKTTLTDPTEVVRRRQYAALTMLDQAIAQNDWQLLLRSLDKLNPVSLTELSTDTLLGIIQSISLNQPAIAEIWDPSKTRFKIKDVTLPEEISIEMRQYRQQRYRLFSLANLVDHYLINELTRRTQNDPEELKLLTQSLIDIATSDAYASSDQQLMNDQLWSAITFCLDKLHRQHQSSSARNYAHELSNTYSLEDEVTQDLIKRIHPSYLMQLVDLFPDVFEGWLNWDELSESQLNRFTLQIPQSEAELPNFDALAEKLAQNPERDITLLFEVLRPIRATVERADIYTSDFQSHYSQGLEIDGGLSVGALNLDENDHLEVVQLAVEMVMELLPTLENFPDREVNIIAGSWLNTLSRNFTGLLMARLIDQFPGQLHEVFAVLNRLKVIEYHTTREQYVRKPFFEVNLETEWQ